VAPRDRADEYTVVGATRRSTYANWLTPIEEHFVCHRNDSRTRTPTPGRFR
jgi:hypothetical protein